MGCGHVEIAAELWKLCSPRPRTFMEVVSNDIPSDAEITGVGYEVREGRIILSFKSETIPDDDCSHRFQGPVFRTRKEIE